LPHEAGDVDSRADFAKGVLIVSQMLSLSISRHFFAAPALSVAARTNGDCPAYAKRLPQ
jgi:hypothetical protein